MGKKKPFIDKKNSTKLSLLYFTGEDGVSERVLIDHRTGLPLGKSVSESAPQKETAGPRYPPGHPLAWLNHQVEDMGEDKRKEIIELGLPDDGYDYTKHLRTVGQGRARLEALPSTSSQPEEIEGGQYQNYSSETLLVSPALSHGSVFLLHELPFL